MTCLVKLLFMVFQDNSRKHIAIILRIKRLGSLKLYQNIKYHCLPTLNNTKYIYLIYGQDTASKMSRPRKHLWKHINRWYTNNMRYSRYLSNLILTCFYEIMWSSSIVSFWLVFYIISYSIICAISEYFRVILYTYVLYKIYSWIKINNRHFVLRREP